VKGILQIDLITIKQEIPWRKWNNLDEIGQGLQWNSGFKYSGAAKYIYSSFSPWYGCQNCGYWKCWLAMENH